MLSIHPSDSRALELSSRFILLFSEQYFFLRGYPHYVFLRSPSMSTAEICVWGYSSDVQSCQYRSSARQSGACGRPHLSKPLTELTQPIKIVFVSNLHFSARKLKED